VLKYHQKNTIINVFMEPIGCVQKGIGESYGVMFDGKVFSANVIETAELYPKFLCEKVSNYQENELPNTTPLEEKDL
jgi:hypothetical protein